MAILDTIGLESNKLFKINFNGGDLSSDGGLLLIREFAAKIGFIRLINASQQRCRKALGERA